MTKIFHLALAGMVCAGSAHAQSGEFSIFAFDDEFLNVAADPTVFEPGDFAEFFLPSGDYGGFDLSFRGDLSVNGAPEVTNIENLAISGSIIGSSADPAGYRLQINDTLTVLEPNENDFFTDDLVLDSAALIEVGNAIRTQQDVFNGPNLRMSNGAKLRTTTTLEQMDELGYSDELQVQLRELEGAGTELKYGITRNSYTNLEIRDGATLRVLPVDGLADQARFLPLAQGGSAALEEYGRIDFSDSLFAGQSAITGAGSEVEFTTNAFVNGAETLTISDGGRLVQQRPDYLDAVADRFTEEFGFDITGSDIGLRIVTDSQRADQIRDISGSFTNPTLIVDGIGSEVSTVSDIEVAGTGLPNFFADGSPLTSTGELHVRNGGIVRTPFDVVLGSDRVDGSTAILDVGTGGAVYADAVQVRRGGLLRGDGGTLFADVVLDGGVIAPGASPGIMTIDGDLNVIGGVLQFEVAGTTSGLFDQLIISGSLFAPSNSLDVEISFLDDFFPDAGASFNFLSVLGDTSGLSADSFNVVLKGLADDTRFDFDFAGGNLSLEIDGDGTGDVSPIPLPATAWMLLTAFGVLGAARKRRVA